MKFTEIYEEGRMLDESFERTLSLIAEQGEKLPKKKQKIVDLWMLGSNDDEKAVNGPVMTGEELAKEFNVTRRFIDTATGSAIMKFYKPLRKNLGMSPLEAIVTTARVLGVEKDQDGIIVIFRNLDNAAKRESLEEIKKTYPKLISAVEIEILGMDLKDLYGQKTSAIKLRDKAFDKGDTKAMKQHEKQYTEVAKKINVIIKKQLKYAKSEENAEAVKELTMKLNTHDADIKTKKEKFKSGERMRPPKAKKKDGKKKADK